VTYGHKLLALTPKEYALLELLLRNRQRVFSCGVILEHLWSFEDTPGEEAVRTHIKGLRHKLKAAGAPADLVETVYGIGYRLKPLDTISAGGTLVTPSEQIRKQTLSAIANIWEHYQGRIKQQVGILEQAAVAVRNKNLTSELHQQAKQEAHTLAGSLGTFGFVAASQSARAIEQLLHTTSPLGKHEANQLHQWVKALYQDLEDPPQELTPKPKSNSDLPRLLIIDRNPLEAQQLMAEATNWDLQAEQATTLTIARQQIYQHPPSVVLLDLNIADNTKDSLKLLAELSRLSPPIPVLVFTNSEPLPEKTSGIPLLERLEVARLGGRTFLQKPLSPTQVLTAVAQVLHYATPHTGKIMVVDDDPQILSTLCSLLEPWGLQVTTLNNPQQFWETLEATSPDLLILDIKMPDINGIELCQVVRNDARWGGLPIMILTAYLDAETINQVFAVGADDFVSKPIIGPELIARIINRLERIKLLRSLAETDPLTKVANRHKSTQDLDNFLHLAKQNQEPVCIGVLDLDNFKQINDRYGHATGDAVLQQLAQLLRQSFRVDDVVARWGGEEFVIGMYGSNKLDGMQRLTKLLDTLHLHSFKMSNVSQPQQHDPEPLRVTFSAGVAQYPEDGTDLHSLYRQADAALYQAKAAGRDQILCA
jgi:diguanylate cyclase (GGDEF)-like protein